MRRVLVAGLLVAAAAACSGDDGGEDTAPKPRPEATSERTTTTLAATGPEEWVAQVRDVLGRVDALHAEPDPAQVGGVFAETCDCHALAVRNVEVLAEAGLHIEADPLTVLAVKVETNDEATGFVRLTVQWLFPGERVVDADGQIVQENPADPQPTCESFGLMPDGTGGDYRIHDRLSLTGCPSDWG